MASLRSQLISVYLGEGFRELRRTWYRARRGRRRRLIYVHQVDDPYGINVVQRLDRLLACEEFDFELRILPPTGPAFAPDRRRLQRWALRDAARQAQTHELDFPKSPRHPGPLAIDRALSHALALESAPPSVALKALRDLALALFDADASELPSLPSASLVPDPVEARRRLDANTERVHAQGHYQGAMVAYEGEWYWGLDRLPLLGARLADEGVPVPRELLERPAPFVARRESNAGEMSTRAKLEFFFSFRSPYSYLAFRRVRALAERHGVELEMRLVLPMVMRGLQVPRLKRLYMARDCARVAAIERIPFGRIADPLGRGVERCMAIADFAASEGRLLEWIDCASTAIWSRGIDTADDDSLRELVVEAGLDPHAALATTRASEAAWRDAAERNRLALLDMGLWGVPCFRFGALELWGQDRIDVLDVALASGRTAGPAGALI